MLRESVSRFRSYPYVKNQLRKPSRLLIVESSANRGHKSYTTVGTNQSFRTWYGLVGLAFEQPVSLVKVEKKDSVFKIFHLRFCELEGRGDFPKVPKSWFLFNWSNESIHR